MTARVVAVVLALALTGWVAVTSIDLARGEAGCGPAGSPLGQAQCVGSNP